jgi:hypothetical protein
MMAVVNAIFLFQHSVESWRIFRVTRSLNNEQRRRLIMPRTSRTLEEVEERVSPRAVLWLVSEYEPEDWIYFLYPRLVAKGSTRLADLPFVLQQHPGDWVMRNYSKDPAQDYLSLWPPARAGFSMQNAR